MYKSRIRAAGLFLLACLLAVCVGCIVFTIVRAAAGQDLFSVIGDAEDIRVTEGASLPESFGVDSDKGIKITSYNENSMVELNRTIYGSFDMAFRPVSKEKGTGDMVDRKIDYATLTVMFVDATDENNYFSVEFNGNEYWGSNYIKAMVSYKNFTGGRNQDYNNDIMAPGTTVNGSFECSSPYTCKTSFAYDADTNQVIANTYTGGEDGGSKNYVIADLDDEQTMGSDVFGGFPDGYKVRIRMSALVEPTNSDRPAEVIVYSMNGQRYESFAPENNIGPTSRATFVSKAVVGKEYGLPEASTYDMLDGAADFASNDKNAIRITAPGGTVTELAPTETSFVPQETGTYTIEYTACDAQGVAGIAEQYSLEVLAEVPDIEIRAEGENRDTVAVGKTFFLAPASAHSALSLLPESSIDCFVSVKKDGEIVLQRTSAETAAECMLAEEGEYEIVYEGIDHIGTVFSRTDTILCRNEPDITYEPLPENIFIDTPFDMPAVSARYNGADHPVETWITTPYGETEQITEATYTPAYNGDYVLTYRSYFGEDEYAEEVIEFKVGISASDLFYSIKNGEIASNTDAPEYSVPFNGVKLTGYGDGSSVGFTNVIDASTLTKEQPLVEFQVTPQTAGEPEFKKLFVYLTDITDPSNKITIEIINSQWDNRWAYIKASGDDGILLGIWYDGVPDENGNYPILDNFNGGTQIRNSFAGVPYLDVKAKIFKIYYDNEEKALYTEDHYNKQSLIIDLDDPAHVGGGREWGGFKSGQVQISFAFSEVVSSSANILVKSIAGQEMGSLSLTDSTAPAISLDTLGNETAPVAGVGMRYRVPVPAAFDMIDGRIEEISISIAHEDGTAYQAQGGYFVPDKAGTYVITYTCRDRSANVAVREYELECLRQVDPIAIEYDGEVVGRVSVGEDIFVPEATASGGSGNKTLATYLSFNSRVLDVQPGYTYRADRAGTYVLYSIAEDYLGQRTVITHEIEAGVAEKPVQEESSLPDAMIDGESYLLPERIAYDYNFGEDEEGFMAAGEIYCLYDGQKTPIGADRVFVPRVKNSGDTVTIVYRSYNEAGETLYEYPVTVVKPEYITDYFLKDGVSTQMTEEYVSFGAEKSGASFSFINPISSGSAELSFNVDPQANAFDYFDVWFTDAENKSNAFFVRIRKRPMNENGNYYQTSYASINGTGRDMEISGSYYGNSRLVFRISYADSTKELYSYSDEKIGAVEYTASGTRFSGFEGKVYVKVVFGNVTGEANLQMIRIMNQSVYGQEGEAFIDRTPPSVSINGIYSYSAEIGSDVRVYSASVTDVIDVNAKITVSVTDPNGNVLWEKSAAEDNFFRAETYGIYRIRYTATDKSGRSFSYPVMIQVEDVVPPEVTVGRLEKTVYAAGESVLIPDVAVHDNHDETPDIFLFVKTPLNQLIPVEAGGEYLPPEEGRYTLIVIARDGDYSYTIDRQTFTAVE